MAFENEFFEMAQPLEENTEMIQTNNKLAEPQVLKIFFFYSNISLFFYIETCFITFNE